MKIRTDFVTNSSSSSFVVVYEINDCKEFRERLKEELGNAGLKLADEYLIKGKDLDKYSDGTTDIHDYLDDPNEFNDDNTYFSVTHFTYSDDENDFNNPSIFLEMFLPKEYIKKIGTGDDF